MDADELSVVYELVREHFEKTGSRRAEAILDVWDVYRGQFWKVAPRQASIAAEANASRSRRRGTDRRARQRARVTSSSASLGVGLLGLGHRW